MELAFEPRFEMTLNGIVYSVGIATREAMDGIAGTGEEGDERAEGVTAPAAGIIAIADDVPDQRRPAVFWHEVLHAAFGEVGVGVYAAIVLCKDEEARRSQENLCSFIGPLLSSAMGGPSQVAKSLAGPISAKKHVRQKGRTRPKSKGKNKSQAKSEGRSKKPSRVRGLRAQL